MRTGVICYFVTIILTLLLLFWWRSVCENNGEILKKFPAKIHVLILSITSLCPVWNYVQFFVLITIYIVGRITSEIDIKKTKFTDFWFDKNK